MHPSDSESVLAEVASEFVAPAPALEAGRVGGLSDAIATFQLPFYGRLWSSNLIQFVCFQVLFLAMQWLVTSISDWRLAVGMIAFLQGGTIALVSPMAGVIVDRYPKRNLLLAGRLGLATVAMSVGFLVWADVIAYWQLLAVSILGGSLSSLVNPATQTFVVDVVGRRRTDHAISLNAIGTSFGMIGGGALAGVLIGVAGTVSTFMAAAVGVVISASILFTIPIRGASARIAPSSPLQDLKEGFAYIRARPHLLLALFACAMALFNGAIAPMRVVFARHVLEVDAASFGLMTGANGLGTLIAAVYVIARPPKGNFGLLIAGTMLVYAIGVLLYSFAFSFEWILVVEGVLGLSGQLWNIYAMIGFQLSVPAEMRGRVLAMVLTLAQLGFVGSLLASLLADFAGDQLAVGIFGLIPTLLLSCVLLFGWKTLKKM